MAHVNVITSSQLGRIRAQVASLSDDEAAKQEERLRLKQLSDERAAKWPNTLQAARARKERARHERLAAEEAEREEADRREAAAKAEQRRLACERANKMLFDETDDVKALHSKLMLSEVLAENQALVAHKQRAAAVRKQQDADFLEQRKQALRAAEAVEQAQLERAKAAALEQKEVQMQQLEELKHRILGERAANKAEGELIRRKATEEAAELAAKEAAWRERAREMNAATKASNDTLLAFRAAERQREAQLEQAVEEFCQRKAELDAQRAAERAAKEAKKEAHRKAMRDMMEENYKRWHAHNQQQLAADIQAAEEKADASAEAARRRRKEQMASAHRSNQQQLAAKAAAKTAAAESDAAFRAAWAARLDELKQEERQEAADARARAFQVQRFRDWQVATKGARKAAQKLADTQDALMAAAAVEAAGAQISAYSELLLHEAGAVRGLDTKPLALHAARRAVKAAALSPAK